MKRLTINIPNDRGSLYEVLHYPAGEIQVRLTGEGIFACTGKDEYVIKANPIPDIVELAQLKDALDAMPVKWFWTRLDLPYLPYARADRRFVPGDSFGLKVFADLINSLHFHTVDTFDVHSPIAKQQIPNLVNIDPIHARDQITACVESMGGPNGFCFIAPDAGALKRYDLASYGWPVVIGGKKRDPETGKLSGFEIEPRIREFSKGLIVDDICDGGGTFIGLAQEINRLNPDIKLGLYTSHGIYSKGLDVLFERFEHIFTSDYSFHTEYFEEATIHP